MKVLVTGGLGFIGQYVCRKLLDHGHDVVILDSVEPQSHSDRAPQLPKGADLVIGSVGNRARVRMALQDVEAVVHLAAIVGVGQSMYEPARYVQRNTADFAMFLQMLRERPLQRLVVASSMSIYGEGAYESERDGKRLYPISRNPAVLAAGVWDFEGAIHAPTREDKPLHPASVYAITKRDHEELALVVGEAYGIPTLALRFFNVYGPGQALSNPYTGAAAIFACQALDGQAPTVYEDGRQLRDFVHVEDVAEAVVRATEARPSVSGYPINIGTGRPHTILELAATLSNKLGGPTPQVLRKYRVGDVRHCYADERRAIETLGFRAAVTLREGLNELADYIQALPERPRNRTAEAARELTDAGMVR